ncbi:hypothetical protein [Candidatus Albibeggiatoa sp. nov. BB20]|uniref:hypothetical protein n=1 Tax=Candidatus Albibeggiatoa sp. nov. BB20 TaxID=3162723 RepID=UPI003365A6E3
MIDNLLHQHQKPLQVKNILDKQNLLKIIRVDYEKIMYALLELRNKPAFYVISDFFQKNDKHVSQVMDKLKDEHLSHIGFEILEPLNLSEYGFEHGFNRFNQELGTEMCVTQVQRFPASQAFQDRVDAFTEIMRIWIQLDHREVMLELFDIHKPVNDYFLTHNTATGHAIDDEQHIFPHAHTICFAKDDIWHYALDTETSDDVLALHDYFKYLASHDDHYILPFKEIVNNKNDGSFYTKIINTQRQIEIEFVTHVDVPRTKARKPQQFSTTSSQQQAASVC